MVYDWLELTKVGNRSDDPYHHAPAQHRLQWAPASQPRVEKRHKIYDNSPPQEWYFIGSCLALGINTAPDMTMAMEFFKRAADTDMIGAQYIFGKFHLDNKAPFSDSLIGLRYMMMAAKNGHKKAQYTCATYYENQKRYEEAFAYFKLCADEHHDACAQFKVGHYYAVGRGTTEDLIKSFAYIKQSAEQGINTALNRLGLCYLYGYGTDRNIIEAIRIFKQAAEHHERHALYNLGMLYLCGVILNDSYILQQDLHAAKLYFRRSAQLGYKLAEIEHDRLHGCVPKPVPTPQPPPKPDLTDEFELIG